MAAYFVDTWFFIAYLRESDPHHRTATRLAGVLREASFVTHDGVLTELLMLRRNITRVLTNDHHFAQEGFTLLNA